MTRLSTSEYIIRVPGVFRNEVVYLDLETEKVPIEPAFVMKNGELLRKRWSIIMYGAAINGEIHLSDNSSEAQNLTGLGDLMADGREVVYAATREFDEMIAKGRFTNARRAHEPEPFFLSVPGADRLPWRNLGQIPWQVRKFRGDRDMDSAKVPEFFRAGHRVLVQVHLLRDVVSLILTDTDKKNVYPDLICRDWCEHVLASYDFARSQILGAVI